MPRSQIFTQYLQLRHFIKLKIEGVELRMDISEIEDVLLHQACLKGSISKIYGTLSYNCTSTLVGLKGVWEMDLGQAIEDNDWAVVCDNHYPKSTSRGIHEFNFKFFNRIYLTPICIKKIFANTQVCASSVIKKKIHLYIVFGIATTFFHTGKNT